MTDCTISGADYSCSCTSLKHKIVMARKTHLCAECGKNMQAKTKYEYFVGVFDGDLYISKTCLDCVSLRDTFFPSGGYVFGHVRDYVSEQIYSLRGEVSSACILPLTDNAKKFVFTRIENTYRLINKIADRRVSAKVVQHYPDRRRMKKRS
jgi:hypothetical protein